MYYKVNDTATGKDIIYSGTCLREAIETIIYEDEEIWDLYREEERIYSSATNTLEELKNVFAYPVLVFTGEHDGCSFVSVDNLSKVFYDRTEAHEYYDSLLATIKAEFNEELHLSLYEVYVEGDEYEDFSSLEESLMAQDFCPQEERQDTILHDYKSIEGALLVEWSWDRYIGYAREFRGVRFGSRCETEVITIPVDHTFYPQVSVVLTAEEVAEFGEDAISIAHERILDMGKWRNPSRILPALEYI